MFVAFQCPIRNENVSGFSGAVGLWKQGFGSESAPKKVTDPKILVFIKDVGQFFQLELGVTVGYSTINISHA
jgi:hypothetical protein